MSITRVYTGPYVNGTNITLTASLGSFTPLANDLILTYSGSFMGTQTIADPSGWTRGSPNSGAKQTAVWGKVSTGSGDTIPGLNWGVNAIAWACVDVYRGCLADITQVFDTANSGDDQANEQSSIRSTLGSKTPGGNGYLALCFGTRNKTSASDTTSFTAPTNFTRVGQLIVAGTNVATARCEWIQTTATAVPLDSSIIGSVNDGSVQTTQYILVFLKPAGAYAPYPPMALGGMNVQVCQ